MWSKEATLNTVNMKFVIVSAVLNLLFCIMYYKTRNHEDESIFFPNPFKALGFMVSVGGIYVLALTPAVAYLSGYVTIWWIPRAYLAYIIILLLYSFTNCFSFETNRRGVVITSIFNVLLQIGMLIRL